MAHIVMQLERGTVNDARWGVFDAEWKMIRAETIGVEQAKLIARVLDDPEALDRARDAQRFRDLLGELARNLRVRARDARALGPDGERLGDVLSELSNAMRRQAEG